MEREREREREGNGPILEERGFSLVSASDFIDTSGGIACLGASKSRAEFDKFGIFYGSARGRSAHSESESERGLRVGAADLVWSSDGHKSESGANVGARVFEFLELRAACFITGDAGARKGGRSDRGADGGGLRSGNGVGGRKRLGDGGRKRAGV